MKKETNTEKKQLVVIGNLEKESLIVPAKIKDEDELFIAADVILKARKMFIDIDTQRTDRTAPANETIKLINADYKKFLEPLKNLEKRVRVAIEDFANRKIKSDLLKLEQLRAETGDESLIIPIGFTNIPSAAGEIRFRKGLLIVVKDISKVPEKYWAVDTKLIADDIENAGGNINIPGVEVEQSSTIALYIK